MGNLFGDEWSDLFWKSSVPPVPTKQPQSPKTMGTYLKKLEVRQVEPVHVIPEVESLPQHQLPITEQEEEIPSSPSISVSEESEPVSPKILENMVPSSSVAKSILSPEADVETSSDESVDVSSDSEAGESEPPPAVPLISEPRQETESLPQPTESTHRPFQDDEVSDTDLAMFAEPAYPFPAFANALEEELFDNTIREKINVVDSLESTYEEIQQLLTAFGIPWVSAPADAEAQCAFLASAGLSDGVISDDSDTLIYGSPIVFRHLYIGESTVEIYRRSELGFNQEELISLAMLLGCDFTVGVRGIGPVNATEIVRHYSGIEGLTRFREWAERFATDKDRESAPVLGEDPEDGRLRDFKITHANYRSQWLFPEDFPSQEVWDVFDKPIVDTSLEPLSWATPDERLIVEVVTSLTSMRVDEVEHLLNSTMTQYRQASLQRRITDYFSPVFERGTVAEVVSKRLKAALDKATVPS